MYREVRMVEITEVLRLWRDGVPKKRIAALFCHEGAGWRWGQCRWPCRRGRALLSKARDAVGSTKQWRAYLSNAAEAGHAAINARSNRNRSVDQRSGRWIALLLCGGLASPTGALRNYTGPTAPALRRAPRQAYGRFSDTIFGRRKDARRRKRPTGRLMGPRPFGYPKCGRTPCALASRHGARTPWIIQTTGEVQRLDKAGDFRPLHSRGSATATLPATTAGNGSTGGRPDRT
jgi:hypothetical protein